MAKLPHNVTFEGLTRFLRDNGEGVHLDRLVGIPPESEGDKAARAKNAERHAESEYDRYQATRNERQRVAMALKKSETDIQIPKEVGDLEKLILGVTAVSGFWDSFGDDAPLSQSSDADLSANHLSAYERQRQDNIIDNNKKLAELGLLDNNCKAVPTLKPPTLKRPRPAAAEPSRVSARQAKNARVRYDEDTSEGGERGQYEPVPLIGKIGHQHAQDEVGAHRRRTHDHVRCTQPARLFRDARAPCGAVAPLLALQPRGL